MIFDNYDVTIQHLGGFNFQINVKELINGTKFFANLQCQGLNEQMGYQVWLDNRKQFIVEAEEISLQSGVNTVV